MGEAQPEAREQRMPCPGDPERMGGKKGLPTYTHDAGDESMRPRREDEIYKLEHSADSNGFLLSEWMQHAHEDRSAEATDAESLLSCGFWDDFPTVSPVCRGNDGLPFDVDDLAIPFTRWRTESIKAYGNAIVPQVIYEIFRAIDALEQEN